MAKTKQQSDDFSSALFKIQKFREKHGDKLAEKELRRIFAKRK